MLGTALFVMVGFSILGCGSSSGRGAVATTSGGGAPTATAIAVPIVAAAGGQTRTPDGAYVNIPAGALSADATLTIARHPITAADPKASGLSSAAKPVGNGFDISLGGAALKGPILIELPVDPATVPANGSVSLGYYDEQAKSWVFVPTAWDPTRGVASAQVDHLSWWNPFSWDWSSWVAGLSQVLSLRVSEFANVARLGTDGCPEHGKVGSVVNDTNLIRACVSDEASGQITFRVRNQHSFPVNVYTVPRLVDDRTLSGGATMDIVVSLSDRSPVKVVGDLVAGPMLLGFLLEQGLSAYDGVLKAPDYYKNVVKVTTTLVKAINFDEKTDTGIRGFEKLVNILAQESTVELIVDTFNLEGVGKAVVKKGFLALTALESNLTWMDYLINYAANAHNELQLSWTSAVSPTATPTTRSAATPTPTPVPPTATRTSIPTSIPTPTRTQPPPTHSVQVVLMGGYAFCDPLPSCSRSATLTAQGYSRTMSVQLTVIPVGIMGGHFQGYVTFTGVPLGNFTVTVAGGVCSAFDTETVYCAVH